MASRYSLATAVWLAAILTGPGPATAVTVELKDVAADRVERQRAYATGQLPLPGTPSLGHLEQRLAATGATAGNALFIRIFKAESELEVWVRKDERFILLDTYPICHWSGTVGPKLQEGDRQNPEGFYAVTLRQLHRRGRWPRSLNLGFPNAYDKALARTGSYILVHGGCSSTGCFAMTNAVMEEIYGLAEQALKGGQTRVQVHVFPFRMTTANLDAYQTSTWIEFWRNLKEGFDAFEATRVPPRIGLCDKRYVVQQTGPEEASGSGPPATSRWHRRREARSADELACAAAGEAVAAVAAEAAEPAPSRSRKLRRRQAGRERTEAAPAVPSEPRQAFDAGGQRGG